MEQLQRVGGRAHHQALVERVHHRESALGGEGAGELQRFLKVVPVLDQFRALRLHGAVFLLAVAVGNHDDGADVREPRRHGHALPVIAAGCRDHAAQIRAESGGATPCRPARRAA